MGKTIFISSHILAEIGEMCTSIAILEVGRLLYSGPISEIRKKLTEETGKVIRVRVAPGNGKTEEDALPAAE